MQGQEEEKCYMGIQWVVNALEVDDEEVSEGNDGDDNSPDEIKALKTHSLESNLESAATQHCSGQGVPVADTNILLSWLMVPSPVENIFWAAVIPLLVIIEHDGVSFDTLQKPQPPPGNISHI